MNRTQRLSFGSALGLGLFKKSSSSTVSPPSSPINNTETDSKTLQLEDEIGPLTASPPPSPAVRLASSSASFFPTSSTTGSLTSKSQLAPPLKDLNRIGSFAVHNLPKLRESKWFAEAEARIFCVVAEVGFIVEIRRRVEKQVEEPAAGDGGKEREYKSLFGVVTKKECINQSAEDKKLHTYKVEITTIDERKKLDKLKLTDVWATNNEIRINNFNDKNKQPHDPKDILDKILFARRAKNLSWHNTEHFSYWCRYGDKPVESVQRRRQVSECIRWGSHAGIGTGMLMLINRRKTTSK